MSANALPTRRLKYAATINDAALGEDTPPDYELQYIDIGNVDSEGRIHDIAAYRFEAAPSRARRQVRHGDVIISTVRTYLQAIAPIIEPPENLVVSTGFAVVRPMPGVLDQGFCRYALREPKFLSEVICRSVGVSYPAINASDLASIPIPLPPISRQRAIADYLDHETAKIDEMITAKERLLGILAEKRRALVTQAVTRGLNPAAPMRDSGIEWLGDVPSHWKPIKLRWLFKQVKRQGFPDLPPLSVYRDFGVILRESRDDNANRVPEDLDKYQLVEPGDLVINKMKAWQGSLGISALTGITSPDYVVFAPVHDERPRFLNFLLRIPTLATVYLSMSNGIRTNQWRLEPDRFVMLDLCLPPTREQEEIVSHVESRITGLDGLHAATIESIRILRERRSALIAAAVTGQIDVEAAA
nr:restriction endonuclease subunit S [Nitrosomonas nitrosa]